MMIQSNIVLFNKQFYKHLQINWVIHLSANNNKKQVKSTRIIILIKNNFNIMNNNYRNLKKEKELKQIKLIENKGN